MKSRTPYQALPNGRALTIQVAAPGMYPSPTVCLFLLAKGKSGKPHAVGLWLYHNPATALKDLREHPNNRTSASASARATLLDYFHRKELHQLEERLKKASLDSRIAALK